MAIAFWAHNNNALINNTNLKIHYYPNEEADLYIHSMNTIDSLLLAKIRASGIYSHTYFIDAPHFDKRLLPFQFLPKVRRLVKSKYIKKYYHNIFYYSVPKDRTYHHLFVPGLWINTVYFVRHFAKINPKLKISYVDEGTSSFYFSRNKFAFFFTQPLFKDKIIAFWEEFFLRLRYKRKFDGRLFLYGASAYDGDDTIHAIPLPPINENNLICKHILLEASSDNFLRTYRYNRAQAIFFTRYETTMVYQKKIVDGLLDVFSCGGVVIKNHPSSIWMRKNFGRDYKCFVDNDIYLFETNLLHEDFNNKIIITFNSAVALFAKISYGQEPFLIFTYRLYDRYARYGDDETEKYVNDIKKLYNNPDKVFVPNTMTEYKLILRDLEERTIVDVTNNKVINNIAFLGVNKTSLDYLKAITNLPRRAYLQVLDVSAFDSSTEPGEKANNAFSSMNASDRYYLERVHGRKDLEDDIDIAISVISQQLMFDFIKDLLNKKRVRFLIFNNAFFHNTRDYYRFQHILEHAESKAWVEYPLVSEMAPFLEELAQELSPCEVFSVDISGGDWGHREEAAGFLDMIHRLNGERAEPTLDFSAVEMRVPPSEGDADIKFYGRISGNMGRCAFTMASLEEDHCPFRISILSERMAVILYPSENTATIAKASDGWRIDIRKIREEGQENFAKIVMESLLTTGDCPLTDYDTVVWEHVPLAKKFAEALDQANEKKAMKRKKKKRERIRKQAND